MLTEAYRGQVDYCEPEGMSVSQLSSSVTLDRSGQPDGEREVDHSRKKEMSISQLVLVSRETRTVLTASFLKTPKLRKWSIEQGNLWEKTAQMHRLGPYLMNRDK